MAHSYFISNMVDNKKKYTAHDKAPHFPFPFLGMETAPDFIAKYQTSDSTDYYKIRKSIYYKIKFSFLRFFAELLEKKFGRLYFLKDKNQSLEAFWNQLLQDLRNRKYVNSYFLRPVYNDVPKFFRITLECLSNRERTDGKEPYPRGFAHGVSQNFDEALSKSFGEFFERLPLMTYREKDLTPGSFIQMVKRGYPALDPSLVSGKRYRKGRRIEDDVKSEKFLWVRTQRVGSNKSTYVPAQCVYWNYNHVHSDWREGLIRECNTNGCASGRSVEEATLTALYELIQRDGILSYWLNGVVPDRIIPKQITDTRLGKLISDVSRYRFDYYFLDVTTEVGVPSVMCVLVDKTNIGPRICVGGGSGYDLEECLYRSLIESMAIYTWMRESKDSGDSYLSYRDVSKERLQRLNIEEKGRFWAHPDNYHFIEPFIKGGEVSLEQMKDKFAPEKSDSIAEKLHRIVCQLEDKGEGYEVYRFVPQHNLLDAYGTKSVRVIVPKLLYMYINETGRGDGDRLRSVGRGISNGRGLVDVIPDLPHPFL